MKKPYVIGVDMGGTNTVFGIVDSEGKILASDSIKTAVPVLEDYIDQFYNAVDKLIKDVGVEGQIQGIGIGAPNANYFTGAIEAGVNLPWPTPIP
ncbi:MAG: ROK family protein, partial [Muribaculaceae bacterium]|nr:ROK family protein [Muribaculaceae bacterium]